MQVERSSFTDIVNSTMSHFCLPLFVVYWAIMYRMGIITVGQSASTIATLYNLMMTINTGFMYNQEQGSHEIKEQRSNTNDHCQKDKSHTRPIYKVHSLAYHVFVV